MQLDSVDWQAQMLFNPTPKKNSKNFIAITYSKIEMGAYYYGLLFCFPCSQGGHNAVWVIVDWLTKTSRFFLIKPLIL